MNEDYFVSISDHDFLEKSLLSTAKSFLEFSILNQRIQEIKLKKSELLNKLKIDLDDISTLITEFEEKLPHKELLKAIKPKPTPKPSTTTHHTKKKVPIKRSPISKLDQLNASLAEIEQRLEELS